MYFGSSPLSDLRLFSILTLTKEHYLYIAAQIAQVVQPIRKGWGTSAVCEAIKKNSLVSNTLVILPTQIYYDICLVDSFSSALSGEIVKFTTSRLHVLYCII